MKETNRYAHQQFQAQGKDSSNWNIISDVEFMAWLGIVLAMGFHRLPSLRDYWSTNDILGTPALVKAMSRFRFEEINRYIHLNDNTKMPERESPDYDKLFKVRPFIDAIKANFLIQYHPNEHQSVDEAMIKYKGRTSLKQYMPKKPVKRGIKMWCRADPLNGYLHVF